MASYDQQPFTRVARSWKSIWFELPDILKKLRIFTLKDVSKISIIDIENKLKNTTFYNYHPDSTGTNSTSYSVTFKDTLKVCEELNILEEILNASTSREVKKYLKEYPD